MNFQKLIEISRALLDWTEHGNLRTYHVSFLIRRSKILSIGINKKCGHTINLRNRKFNRSGVDISAVKFQCAEMRCLKKSKSQNINYSKCKMVNVRINRENKISLSSPCSSCQSLLNHFGVSDIYFTNDDGNFEKFSKN